MSTQEIADRLVELCRMGKFDQAYDELFAESAVGIEPAYTQQPEAKGLDALRQKSIQFANMMKEFHGSSISDPVVSSNHFACSMMIDTTDHEGVRSKMDEVCVYEVQDGKIVKEQFFY